ncbi:hypothetical protein FB107DRAFT_210765 [Schizophyllum commune]
MSRWMKIAQVFRPFYMTTPADMLPAGLAELKTPPLYYRKPPTWMKFSWFIAGGAVVSAINMSDLTWEHWTEFVEDEASFEARARDPSLEKKGKWELRPWYQRLGMCGLQLSAATMLSVIVVLMRYRTVKRLDIFRHSAQFDTGGPTLLLAQCAHHTSQAWGYIRPIKQCTLSATGATDHTLYLTLAGDKADRKIDLRGALIRGKELPPKEARAALIEEFGAEGKLKGVAQALKEEAQTGGSGWKSGPVKERQDQRRKALEKDL